MGSKLVRDVMHQGLIACWATESLVEVAQRMCDDSIHAIFVLNENGQAAGIISQTDLADAFVQGAWPALTAEDIMISEIVSVTADTPLEIAIEVMLNRNIHRLLVVQEENLPQRPTGVLSLSDVVCEMANSVPFEDDESELLE